MRSAFAHDAILRRGPAADRRAPRAAITVAWCDAWAYPPPCPLAPHHRYATRVDDERCLRVRFPAAPALEEVIRERSDRARQCDRLRGPDGALTGWRLWTSGRSAVAPDEATHAHRLLHS